VQHSTIHECNIQVNAALHLTVYGLKTNPDTISYFKQKLCNSRSLFKRINRHHRNGWMQN